MQNKLSYCGNVLRHIKNRPDLNLGDFGSLTLEFYSRFRSVLPEQLLTYYEILSNLSGYLDRYATLAESCSKSGAYQNKRLECLQQIKTIIHNIEQDVETTAILRGMHQHGSFPTQV
jgi:hypothetical protein